MCSGLSVQNPDRAVPGGDLVRNLLRKAAQYVARLPPFCLVLTLVTERDLPKQLRKALPLAGYSAVVGTFLVATKGRPSTFLIQMHLRLVRRSRILRQRTSQS